MQMINSNSSNARLLTSHFARPVSLHTVNEWNEIFANRQIGRRRPPPWAASSPPPAVGLARSQRSSTDNFAFRINETRSLRLQHRSAGLHHQINSAETSHQFVGASYPCFASIISIALATASSMLNSVVSRCIASSAGRRGASARFTSRSSRSFTSANT